MIQCDRGILEARDKDYDNFESYHASMLKMNIGLVDQLENDIWFMRAIDTFSCVELFRIMPVCKRFFLMAREATLPKIVQLIAERQLAKKTLEPTFSIYDGLTGC